MSRPVYVHLPSGVRGPFGWQQMQQGAAQGKITPQHQLSYDGVAAFPAAQIWSELVATATPANKPAANVAAPVAAKVAVAAPSVNAPAISTPAIGVPAARPQPKATPATVEAPANPIANSGGNGPKPAINVGPAVNARPAVNLGVTPKPVAAKKVERDYDDEEEEQSPTVIILIGVAIMAVGVGLYFWFDHLEQEGGLAKFPSWLRAVYEALGKWGLFGVVSGLGLLVSMAGVGEMRTSRGDR